VQKSTVPVNCGDYVFCKNSVAGAKYRALPADENLTWLLNLCGLDVWSTLVDNAVGEAGAISSCLFDGDLQDGFVNFAVAHQWCVSNLREEDDE